MFEETLVESRGLVGSGTERWTALGSMTIQCGLAGLLIAIPLLRPEVLRVPYALPAVALPSLSRPPMPVVIKAVAASLSSSAMSMPADGPARIATAGPSIWPLSGKSTEDGTGPTIDTGPRMGNGDSALPSGLGNGSDLRPGVTVVRAREVGAVRLSGGVSEGLLLTRIQPVYPIVARAARVQGTVVLEAVISKAGRIESLHAVSGPAMLERAAMDAVGLARYRPYLLNGEPTEVRTTITVVFSLGN